MYITRNCFYVLAFAASYHIIHSNASEQVPDRVDVSIGVHEKGSTSRVSYSPNISTP